LARCIRHDILPDEKPPYGGEDNMNENTKSFFLTTGLILSALFFSLLFAACQSVPPKISARDARAEFSDTMKDQAEVYLKIDNKGGPDKIIGVYVTIPGAKALIYEQGGIVMTIAKEFEIPANSHINLRSGASHITILSIPDDVKQGDTFTLTLKFKRSEDIEVPVTLTTPRP